MWIKFAGFSWLLYEIVQHKSFFVGKKTYRNVPVGFTRWQDSDFSFKLSLNTCATKIQSPRILKSHLAWNDWKICFSSDQMFFPSHNFDFSLVAAEVIWHICCSIYEGGHVLCWWFLVFSSTYAMIYPSEINSTGTPSDKNASSVFLKTCHSGCHPIFNR